MTAAVFAALGQLWPYLLLAGVAAAAVAWAVVTPPRRHPPRQGLLEGYWHDEDPWATDWEPSRRTAGR